MATKGTTNQPEEMKMNIYEKLSRIQAELKAPKNQKAVDYKTNKVRYTYRSCEDILEALKPLLIKYRCTLTLEDSIGQIGERFYIVADTKLTDWDDAAMWIGNKAYARETNDNGRMDAAQITGAASSYARKYALNGLFLIDDTRDVDTNGYQEAKQKAEPEAKKEPKKEAKPEAKKEPKKEAKPETKPEELATPHQVELMRQIAEKSGWEFNEENAKKMTMKAASETIKEYAEVLKNE